MTQRCPVADREHRGHLLRTRRGHRANLVDAPVPLHEPPARDPPRQRPPPDPGGRELRRRDDPVLPARKRRDRPIPEVHFCMLDAARHLRMQKRTDTGRFSFTRPTGRWEMQKRTVADHDAREHPTGARGPSPSVPEFERSRRRTGTKSG